jgi:hypothetical protein
MAAPLLKRFDLRCHVRRATDSVSGVAAFQDPDIMIGLGALHISCRAERLVTRKSLQADLRSQHTLRRFGSGGLLRPRRQATSETGETDQYQRMELMHR